MKSVKSEATLKLTKRGNCGSGPCDRTLPAFTMGSCINYRKIRGQYRIIRDNTANPAARLDPK